MKRLEVSIFSNKEHDVVWLEDRNCVCDKHQSIGLLGWIKLTRHSINQYFDLFNSFMMPKTLKCIKIFVFLYSGHMLLFV